MMLGAERTVSAQIEAAWDVLLDVHRVAAALPNGTLTGDRGDGVARGRLLLGDGARADRYNGSMVLEEVDEDEHQVAFRVRGRAERGVAAGVATVRGRCHPVNDGGTRLVLAADLSVTDVGRLEQEAGNAWLATFGAGLEREMPRDANPAHAVPSPRKALERRSPRLAAAVIGGSAVAVAVVVLLRRRVTRTRSRFGAR